MDWDMLDSLYKKGFIDNPKSKAKSVMVPEERAMLSGELFEKYFGPKDKKDPVVVSLK
jgi:hypothetical protein